MKINTLPRLKKSKKRLGRGHSAGQGKTCGRGHKGQKARTGKKLRPGFEGGQTPIFQRLPKYRGFRNINHIDYQVVNVGDLNKLEKEKEINREKLLEHRLIQKKNLPVKILGQGELSHAFIVKVDAASKEAINKIEKAGGSFTSTKKDQETAKKEEETSNKS